MDSVDRIDKSVKDMMQQHTQTLYELTEMHSNDLKQLFGFIIDDMVKTYEDLIAQRNDCIDKYIGVISIILQDEKDISKPIQSLVEKKHANANELRKEIAPLLEFKELMLVDGEDISDDQAKEMIAKFKNI